MGCVRHVKSAGRGLSGWLLGRMAEIFNVAASRNQYMGLMNLHSIPRVT